MEHADFKVVYHAFADAFSDYQVKFDLNFDQFLYMMHSKSVDLKLSFGVFKEPCNTQKLIGFILNGYRKKGNNHVAYDAGTGICRSYQGKGIAAKLLDENILFLKNMGIATCLLEVITTNMAALKLYKNKGFQINRHLSCFIADKKQFSQNKKPTGIRFSIEKIDSLPFTRFASYWNFNPTWQNETQSLWAGKDQLTAVVAWKANQPVGYGVISRHKGDVLQISVDNALRNQGIGSGIINNLSRCTLSNAIRAINVESSDDETCRFFLSIGFEHHLDQYEMSLSFQ